MKSNMHSEEHLNFQLQNQEIGSPKGISQAIRNRVETGVTDKRFSIDMASSEYLNLAPQSQHTL